MRNEPITGGWKKLKENLSTMTPKEKINHLWTYYKGMLMIPVLLIAAISIAVSIYQSKNTELILAGNGINVILSQEGKTYVKDAFYDKEYTKGWAEINYTESLQTDFTDVEGIQENYASLMGLITQCAAEMMDYLFLDEVALHNLQMHDVYMDLRDFFTEAELEALGDKVIWLEIGSEDDEKVFMPVAVNVEHLPFIAQHADNVKDTYFAIVANTPRKDTCKRFWEHLNTWTPATT